jgi:hypothetical protein
VAAKLYDFKAARGSSVFEVSFTADGIESAKQNALELATEVFGNPDWPSYEAMVADTYGCVLRLATTVATPLLVQATYRQLLQELSSRMELSRLEDGSLPEETAWTAPWLQQLAELGETGSTQPG